MTQLHSDSDLVFVSDSELKFKFIQEFVFLDASDMSDNYKNSDLLVEEFRDNQKKYDQTLENFIFEVKARDNVRKSNYQIL